MEGQRVFFTDYQRAELENSFKKFNPNSEGKISIESVNNLLGSLDSAHKPNTYKLGITGSLSFSNGETECDFDMFIKMIEDCLSDPLKFEKALEQSFKLMDLDKKGNINSADLIKLSEILGENISTQEEALRILQRAEISPGDNKLTQESIKSFLKNDINQSYSP
jgi:Ca2+-binding EF-hand superfamily protein